MVPLLGKEGTQVNETEPLQGRKLSVGVRSIRKSMAETYVTNTIIEALLG